MAFHGPGAAAPRGMQGLSPDKHYHDHDGLKAVRDLRADRPGSVPGQRRARLTCRRDLRPNPQKSAPRQAVPGQPVQRACG